MRIGFLASALTAAGHFAAYTYLQPYLFRIVHLAPSATTWVLAASGSAGIVGTFAGERAASLNLRWTFFGTAILLGSAIIMAAVLNGNCVTAIAAVVIWGAAFGAVPVCTQIWTYRSAPERFEPASAMGIAIFQIALAAGSFGGGAVVDHAGVLPAFLLGGALSLSSGLLLLLTQAPSEV